MPAYIYLACIIFLLLSSIAKAQYNNDFETITTKNGLSENVVTCIFQDKIGLLWFGTYDGLNCYDGYHFRIYRHDVRNPHSLPGNHIGKIMQDADGDLWIATDKGAGILNTASGDMQMVFAKNTSEPEALCLLDGGNKKIIFGSGKSFVYDKKSRQTIALIDATGKNIFVTAGFYFDGRVYAALYKSGYLGEFDNIKNQFHPSKKFICSKHDSLYANYIDGLVLDGHQKLWTSARTYSGSHFFHVLNKDGPDNDINNYLSKFSSTFFWAAQGNDGKMWFKSYEGFLFSWNEAYKKFDTIFTRENYSVISAAFDRNNILWIGTKGKGVIKYKPAEFLFNHYQANASSQPLHKNIILGLAPYKNDYLLALHDDDFLSIINIKTGTTGLISRLDLPNAHLYNEEWNKFKKTNNTAGMADILRKTQNLPYEFFGLITTPDSKQILYCDYGGGALRHFDSLQNIILDSITYIWHAWQGDTLWICNETNGLVALHYPEYTSRRFLFEPTDTNSISSDKTRYILFTQNGNLWIATENGLNYYDKRTQKFFTYGEKDGLCNNSIYCMSYDLQGRIWLGTGNGLSCFDTATKKFTNFYTADGLINAEYNRYSACLMPNGFMYMGGTEGIDYFDPSKLISEIKPPAVIISDFSLYDVHYLPEHLPEFSHEDNNVTIAFTAIDYAYPQGNKYLYKLEGVDKDWMLLQGINSVRYSLLPPGNYTFKVKAANHRGVWNDVPAQLSFTILPAWYNTWWFYLLCALFVSAVIYFFINRYTQYKLEKQRLQLEKHQAVEVERLRISSELHDDLGGGLSSISLISEMLKTAPGNEISKQLNKISESSKDLVQKMNEIVWALNINNDNLQSLLAYIRQYAVKTFDDINIQCAVHTPENIPAISIGGNERRNIFLMIKECINNIIKHSKATQVVIEIILIEKLCIKINDNGIGFSCNKNNVHHFGLKNLKQRAEELNGSIEWLQNNGTQVQIQIPLKNLSHKSVSP